LNSNTFALTWQRRLRRPPGRLLFFLLYGLAAASIVFHALIRMFSGHVEVFGPLVAGIWGFHMTLAHRAIRSTWNPWLEGRPTAPVPRGDWITLGTYVTVAIYIWIA
jgi:hypothetical protein